MVKDFQDLAGKFTQMKETVLIRLGDRRKFLEEWPGHFLDDSLKLLNSKGLDSANFLEREILEAYGDVALV
ncbi:hypothetical protein TWF506_003068 [Arthrobotrys conoides]|uniref:Uncharacterized protein n=1 Tax=Arthrobotrys conoides TaxID=74498 RepID=A0AAN8NC64_9PEZI